MDAESLESSGAFKPEHLGYITCIFEGNYNYRFRLWDIQKYKEVTEFIKKLRVCDMDVISQKYLITYESLDKRLHDNNAILWIQSGWNRLLAKKSLQTDLHF